MRRRVFDFPNLLMKDTLVATRLYININHVFLRVIPFVVARDIYFRIKQNNSKLRVFNIRGVTLHVPNNT